MRQLDRLAETALTRAWAAAGGPGDRMLVVDADSTICRVYGHHQQGATDGYTRKPGYHPLLATRADTGEVLHARQRTGKANTARGRPGSSTSPSGGSAAPARVAIPETAWVDSSSTDGGIAQVAETRFGVTG